MLTRMIATGWLAVLLVTGGLVAWYAWPAEAPREVWATMHVVPGPTPGARSYADLELSRQNVIVHLEVRRELPAPRGMDTLYVSIEKESR